jgi:hypothetical protein
MTLEELQEIAKIEREAGRISAPYQRVVAAGLSCQSRVVRKRWKRRHRRSLESWCEVKGVGCLGLCTWDR